MVLPYGRTVSCHFPLLYDRSSSATYLPMPMSNGLSNFLDTS